MKKKENKPKDEVMIPEKPILLDKVKVVKQNLEFEMSNTTLDEVKKVIAELVIV